MRRLALNIKPGRFIGWSHEERLRYCVVQLAKQHGSKTLHAELPADVMDSIERAAMSSRHDGPYEYTAEGLVLRMLGMRIVLALYSGVATLARFTCEKFNEGTFGSLARTQEFCEVELCG